MDDPASCKARHSWGSEEVLSPVPGAGGSCAHLAADAGNDGGGAVAAAATAARL